MLERHGKVTLAVDVMYINEIPIIMTTSRDIHIGMAKLIKNIKVSTIIIASSKSLRLIRQEVSKYDTS